MYEKIIIGCLIVFVAVSSIFNGWQFFTRNRNSQLIDEYRDTIVKLENTVDQQAERYIEIETNYQSIKQQLKDSIERTREATDIIEEIGAGFETDVDTIDQIIEAVRKVREAVKRYYNPT